MRFRYSTTDPSQDEFDSLPRLPLVLHHDNQSIQVVGLVDSGATVNVLPYKVGIQLGASWDERRATIRLVGSSGNLNAMPLLVTAQVGEFAPVRLAFAWVKSNDVPLILWNLPPIKASSHFLQFWGLMPVGPGVDWDQLEFWTRRALARLAGLGVEVVGVYGSFFKPPEGFSKTKAMDQAIRFVDRLADYAEMYDMLIALEPTADPQSLWPMYLDGIRFAREEIGRPAVRVMADINYFIKGKQPFDLIAQEPDDCLHVHIAGDRGQPGVGDLDEVFLRLFRILRDIGYTRGVSAACPWVSTDGGPVDFGKETARSLRYLQGLRDKVYTE